MTEYQGKCLCRAVRYVVSGPLDEVALCHCSQCRRGTGAAFNVGVLVKADQLRFETKGSLREFESSPGKLRAFCDTCGAPVYSRRPDTPDDLRLRGGLIENLPRPAKLYHIHYESRWPWIDRIDEGVTYPGAIA